MNESFASAHNTLRLKVLHAKRASELSPAERNEGTCAVVVSGYQKLNANGCERLARFLLEAAGYDDVRPVVRTTTDKRPGERMHEMLIRFVPNERDVWCGWNYLGARLQSRFASAGAEFAKPYIDELESTKAARDEWHKAWSAMNEHATKLDSELARIKAENAALRDAVLDLVREDDDSLTEALFEELPRGDKPAWQEDLDKYRAKVQRVRAVMVGAP